MKNSLIILYLFISLNASSIEYKGDIGVDYKKFEYDIPYVNNSVQKTLLAQIELKKSFNDTIIFTKIEALKDNDNANREYTKINELYLKYESDNFDLTIGRDIKYWGALELHNITDIYNEKNIENDPYDKDKKLGKDGLTYNYFMENEDSISLIISKDKSQKDDSSSYIKYSGSRDDIFSRDFSYILSSIEESFLMLHTLIYKDTIYKLEYKYANKTNKYHIGAGIEHTLYSFFDKKDLALMIEYYKSNDNDLKYKKDLFLATRVTFNDVSSSDILMGVIKDYDKDKYSYSMQYNTRVLDKFKTKLSYIQNDSLKIFGINISYYF